MRQLQEIRRDLQFQRDFIQLMEGLHNTALLNYTKIKAVEDRYFEEYMKEIRTFAAFMKTANITGKFMEQTAGKPCYILITPDSGLMGGLNNYVVERYFLETKDLAETPITMVLGEKGAQALEARASIIPFSGYKEAADEITSKVDQIKESLFTQIKAGTINRVGVIYPASVSFSKQEVRYERLLPCEDLIEEIKLEIHDPRRVLIESPGEDFAEYLAAQWLELQLYKVLRDAKLSEHSARAMHLSTSKENLENQLKETEDEYRKVRKSLIDKSSREAAAAQQVKKKKDHETKKRLERKEETLALHQVPNSVD
ncbi:ATP synthase gamma chain [uncultured archaeon]|nr:ATP synthase gamma chain [uncultured archaeon]